MSRASRAAHVRDVVCAVIAQTMADAGASGMLVLEDEAPEGQLLVEWTTAALGQTRVYRGTAVDGFRWLTATRNEPTREQSELRRAAARLLAADQDWLLAHPVNKTALLLSREPPPERLLPLGDLYASQILELAGGFTLPPDAEALAAAAGGVHRTDAALAAWLDERRDLESAMASLAPETRNLVRARLQRNRAVRRWPRIVPKLGSRTPWVDLCA